MTLDDFNVMQIFVLLSKQLFWGGDHFKTFFVLKWITHSPKDFESQIAEVL